MKLIFCLQIKIKFSYKLRLSILLGIASHAQNTQSNKFAKSLQYLKKKVRDEVDFLCRWRSKFSTSWYYWWTWPSIPKVLKISIKKEVSDEVNFLHADRHQIFLKIDAIFLDWFGQTSPKYADKFYLYDTSRKKLVMKVIFCMQVNIKVFHNLYYHLWLIW